jgi:Fe-S-cluster containining protein
MPRTRPDPHHHTAGAPDARDARALAPAENADLCAGCVRCCTYITIQIDTPRAAWEYDQWLWTLHHEGIEMYVEQPESWFVHVETRCRQLNAQGRCAIHGRHPVLCRDYDPRTCERRLPLAEIRAWFKNAEQLEEWLRRERPAHWRRLENYRRAQPAGAPLADAATSAATFVPLGSIGKSAAPAANGRGGTRRGATLRRPRAASTR